MWTAVKNKMTGFNFKVGKLIDWVEIFKRSGPDGTAGIEKRRGERRVRERRSVSRAGGREDFVCLVKEGMMILTFVFFAVGVYFLIQFCGTYRK